MYGCGQEVGVVRTGDDRGVNCSYVDCVTILPLRHYNNLRDKESTTSKTSAIGPDLPGGELANFVPEVAKSPLDETVGVIAAKSETLMAPMCSVIAAEEVTACE